MKNNSEAATSVPVALAKPLRCIARMTSLGYSRVMTASTPNDTDLCDQHTLIQHYKPKTVKIEPHPSSRTRRPMSSVMSGEVLLRAYAAANRFTNETNPLEGQNNKSSSLTCTVDVSIADTTLSGSEGSLLNTGIINLSQEQHESKVQSAETMLLKRITAAASQILIPSYTHRSPIANNAPTTSVEMSSASPKFADSGSNSSVDSGQESVKRRSQSRSPQKTWMNPSPNVCYVRNSLPSYARIASMLDHVLRTSSAINSLLNLANDSQSSRELIAKTRIFIHVVEASPCRCIFEIQASDHSFFIASNIAVMKELITNLISQYVSMDHTVTVTSHFIASLRWFMEDILAIFARIISHFLNECVNKDRLLVIALEHLIHLMLFGNVICMEVVQTGGIEAMIAFTVMPATPSDTLRLLLRALAILCGIPDGAARMLSLEGLDTVIHILCTCSTACAVEAAGVLTQLTNPKNALAKLSVSCAHIIARLLDVIDECSTAESLLLSSAALANVSMQQQTFTDNLYQHNAVLRLIAALKRPGCSTIFVHEQFIVIFSRLAAKGYEEALIVQGAIPILLSMLNLSDPSHAEYCRRIRYRTAVCLQMIASKGIGLKALYKNNG
ncbi:unnamed protein product [Anisakis simplex]|uniref:Insc_C domain-containing protein n=1 Tax=Anisakis simplex TaxID=6269 RepID=A0A0M3JVA6_ANISI|nr:unnamed protein product [Anisakis simplex]